MFLNNSHLEEIYLGIGNNDFIDINSFEYEFLTWAKKYGKKLRLYMSGNNFSWSERDKITIFE